MRQPLFRFVIPFCGIAVDAVPAPAYGLYAPLRVPFAERPAILRSIPFVHSLPPTGSVFHHTVACPVDPCVPYIPEKRDSGKGKVCGLPMSEGVLFLFCCACVFVKNTKNCFSSIWKEKRSEICQVGKTPKFEKFAKKVFHTKKCG